MMKAIKIIIGLLVIIFVGVYVVLFTPINKSIIVPIIENKALSALKIDEVKVSNFELTTSVLRLTLLLKNEEINLDSSFDLLSSTIDAEYQVKIKDLSIFNTISKQKLKGTFDTKGKIQGTFDNLKLKGDAQIANGNIDYKLETKAGDTKDIIVGVKELELSKIFEMIGQPQYAKAKVNIDVNVKSLNNLDGKILTNIDDGFLNAKLVKNDFNITLPSKPIFNLKATTILNQNLIFTKSKLNTFAAVVETTKTVFDTKTAILNTDYIVNISNLNNLYFITNQKMKGDMKIIGDVKVDKFLTATFNSKKFDGTINGILKNNKLNVKIKDINSVQLLDMMNYPKVFDSKVNITLNYDLKSKQGEANILMNDGQFLVSELSKNIKSIVGKDLTAEIYKTTIVKTKINDKILDSTLAMESKNSQINSKKIHIDLNKSYIDSYFDMMFYKFDMKLGVKGQLVDPKIKINAGKVLKSKVTKEVKKVEKKIKSKVEEKVKDEIGGFLKKLF